MPKRVRPYGSAVDAEAAALARNRSGAGGELASDVASTITARDVAGQAAEAVRALNDLTSYGAGYASLDQVRGVIASLQRMSLDLPRVCEQLARMLVVQREDGQITPGPGQDPDFWVTEAVEALAAAGQAADMLAAALSQAGKTSGELRSASAGQLCRADLDEDRPAQRVRDRRGGGHLPVQYQAWPRHMPISRSSTAPELTRRPSCSYSLVTHVRRPRIALAVRIENSRSTYMSW